MRNENCVHYFKLEQWFPIITRVYHTRHLLISEVNILQQSIINFLVYFFGKIYTTFIYTAFLRSFEWLRNVN